MLKSFLLIMAIVVSYVAVGTLVLLTGYRLGRTAELQKAQAIYARALAYQLASTQIMYFGIMLGQNEALGQISTSQVDSFCQDVSFDTCIDSLTNYLDDVQAANEPKLHL